jgi:membrane-associated protease RseP (regulator of RpoE activity)
MPISFQELFNHTWGIVLAVLFFGGSIFVHELGHFLAARWRGLKVERFSIGMGPRVFGWTGKDGVDYRVSLLPIGGYVALPQMADMSAVEGPTEDGAERLPPISYADKMWVAIAGAFFNILFALALSFILWFAGVPAQEGSETTVVGHVEANISAGGPLADIGAARIVPGPAHLSGVLPGDRIVSVDDVEVRNWSHLIERVLLGNRRDEQGQPLCYLRLERDGGLIDLVLRPELVPTNTRTTDRIRTIGILPRTSVILGTPIPGSPAEKAGLREGDQVLSVDGKAVLGAESFRQHLRSEAPGPRILRVRRSDQSEVSLEVTPIPVLRTNPVVAITHGAGGEHRVVLIPVPVDGSPGKFRLTVHSSTGEPEVTQALSLGAVLDRANSKDLVAIRSIDDLVKAAPPEATDFQVFWSRGGAEGNVILRAATVRVIQPNPVPSIGADLRAPTVTVHRTPAEQFSIAVTSTLSTLQRLVDRDSHIQLNQLMGAIGIAKMYVNLSDDIRLVIWFSVVININLAILNLLPIPVLDGGHMLQATVERIRRKPLPPKIMIWVQYLFVGLLMSLMAYVLLNDVRRCSGDGDAQLRGELLEKHVIRQIEFK